MMFGENTQVLVIAPVFNESDEVAHFFSTFEKLASAKNLKLSYLLVDDGSTDDTLKKLLEYREKMPNLRIVELELNWGQHPALFAAIDMAPLLDYTIIVDFDLQNTPERAVQMLSYLIDNDYDLVYGMRNDVRIGNGFMSRIFWDVVCALSSLKIPKDQSSLKVFNKKFLQSLKTLPARPEFFPAALASASTNAGFFPVETVARVSGSSRYTQLKKIKLFTMAVLSVMINKRSEVLYKIANMYD